jgi:hypothetical protein
MDAASTTQVGAPDLAASADLIRKVWSRTAEGYVTVSRELKNVRIWAQEEKEFTAWVEAELPFSLRTAERLMTIANNQVLADPSNLSCLPAKRSTLYKLAELVGPYAPVLQKLITDGAITPRMKYAEAEAQVRKAKGKPPKKPKVQPQSDRLKQETSEKVRQATLAALNKLVAVDPGDIDPARIRAWWLGEVGIALTHAEDFLTRLRGVAPNPAAPVVAVTVAPAVAPAEAQAP